MKILSVFFESLLFSLLDMTYLRVDLRVKQRKKAAASAMVELIEEGERGEEGLWKIIFQRRSCNEKNAKVHKNSPPLPRSSHSNRKASREKIHEKCALKWKSLQTTFNLISVSIVDDDVGSWAVKTLSCWTGEFFLAWNKKKTSQFFFGGYFSHRLPQCLSYKFMLSHKYIFFFSML